MSTCGTCAHWGEGAQGTPGRGNCQVIEHQDDPGVTESTLVYLNETSGIASAWLESLADFGCVLWEAKA